ncbi:VCBS repeat-containing protein [Zeaxanthinibacter sp. PT1]|uniref:VCBS repeat-containing protein n=1 Tax=Zeaxanthinibacter TaxID=561554 RepID=UPI0023497A18|nr:VCBS repeat-containing protein [Zeaxanthinibacter sp. PT1]MDC6352639.1 VCBS repeat-containing protein [Zeaxanthinibacter sp. PT1]
MLLLSCLGGCKEQPHDESSIADAEQQQIFERVDPATSGLWFSNDIKENLNTLENLFNFDYFYNGAGVGVEDLNNDGLLDVVFCGNQVGNKIYLNKGDLQFTDITESSGINIGKNWSNGVTFVDINNDDWMDIYISQGGPNPRLSRKNLLFINQKDGTFSEEAEQYGLADMGISTQSAFFDYDNDGDLDCIVMNENELYGVDPINLYKMIAENKEAEYFNSSHLYRNDGGVFTDVSRQAGILRPIFGLGLMVSDINTDGLLDIYIASDYYIPDALFINQGDGTFKDEIKEFTQQISYYGMGIDVADINNDGMEDIFVLDMASSDHYRAKTLMASMSTDRFDYLVNKADFHYQYMFNSLQLNLGNSHYNNIAHMLDMGSSDWSWTVLMSDLDLNGDKDIYITNGYRRYALDNDLQQKVYKARQRYGDEVPIEVKTQLYNAMPSEKLPNLVYQNSGELKFHEAGQEWGLNDLSFSNGAALGDLDNDGDLDLVVNNMDENAFLYQNRSADKKSSNFLKVKLASEDFVKVTVKANGQQQFIETKRVRGYMSAQENSAHFGLGSATKVDTLIIEWPDGKQIRKFGVASNSVITAKREEAEFTEEARPQSPYFSALDRATVQLDHRHRENDYDDFEMEVLLPYKQSTMGPALAKADVNGDGLIDLYIGGASGQSGALFIQQESGFKQLNIEAFQEDSRQEDTAAVFFDLEGDGDLDLYVVSGGNEYEHHSSYYADRIYLNSGNGNFSKAELPVLQSYAESGHTVTAIDYDKDGDQDLLVGNRIIPWNFPRHAPSTLYRNDNGTLVNVSANVAPGLVDFGIINDIQVTDFDQDGWDDFIAVGEWSPIGFFKNEQGTFRLVKDTPGYTGEKGWWFSITETDVNNDGLKDYVIGNAGKNIKFKPSPEKPFKVFATDFDKNGTNDIVLSKIYNGKYVPVRGRECSSQQMPHIKEKFQTYREFAGASIGEVLGKEIDNSYTKEVTEFRSLLLINKGNMKFEKVSLPEQAQAFPIMDAVSMDINQDGYDDMLVAGNLYETEVETPRLDALSGVILISDTQGGYNSVSYARSGIYAAGNIKRMVSLPMKEKNLLIMARNDDFPLLYKFNESHSPIIQNPKN